MSEFYLSDGAHLGYSDSGSGLPVIFLHPTPVDREFWGPLVQLLPQVRAVVPDFRGHGVSELGDDLPEGVFGRVPESPILSPILSIGQLASDVLALLDRLHLPWVVFAGCSIGGYVLLEIWRRAPERVRSLAFICSKPQPDAEANIARRVQIIQRAQREGVRTIFDEMSVSSVGAAARRERPAIVAELRARMTLSVKALCATQAGLAKRVDSVPTVSTIQVPVLAIAGGDDTAVSPSEMEAFQRAPGGCTFHTLPVAGHYAAYEQPRTVATLLTPWLRRFES